MALRFLTGTVIVTQNSTDAVVAQSGDAIILAEGAIRGATGTLSSGIVAAPGANSINIVVQGTLFGTTYGIDLSGATGTHSLTVGATGSVFSDTFAAVYLDGTVTRVTNLGLISSTSGSSSIYNSASTAYITNAGTITGRGGLTSEHGCIVQLVNTGLIDAPGGAVRLANLNDTVWNAGVINGAVDLGDGNDRYLGGGQVFGLINGGLGDDTIIGGAGDDLIYDPSGTNWLGGGDGADRIFLLASAGPTVQISHVFGGTPGGADTSTQDMLGFVDEAGIAVNIFLGGGYATNQSNQLLAVFNGFENAMGTEVNDTLIGSNLGNRLEGRAGADWMVGNGGADTFVFSEWFHATGDQIRDLRRSEGDRIDLSGIDANTTTGTNDAFVFRTTHTNNAAGEMVVTNFGIGARVDLYVNADNISDGHFFVVYGEAGMTNLQASDFLL